MDHSGPMLLQFISFWILCEEKFATPLGEGKEGGRWDGSEWELAIWLLTVLVLLGYDHYYKSLLHPVVEDLGSLVGGWSQRINDGQVII